jgi:hypothetical protein
MKGRAFSKSELELVNDTTLNHTQVANITGRSTSTICLKRKSLGIKAVDGSRVYTDEQNDVITDTSKTNSEVSTILGVPIKVIISTRWRYGITKPA